MQLVGLLQSPFSACRVHIFSCVLLCFVCVFSLLSSLVFVQQFCAFLCSDRLCIKAPKRDLSDKDTPGSIFLNCMMR